MEINLNNVRLLVESTPGMGDLIMLTPALRELKNQFPECEITIMSHPGNLKMVDRLPYVSRVCPIDKSVTGILKTARLLHQQDIIIFTTWQSLYARMLKFLRVSFCAGVCKEKYLKRKYFHLVLPHLDSYGTQYRPQSIANQLEQALGMQLSIDAHYDVSTPTEEEWHSVKTKLHQLGRSLNEEKPYIVFAPVGRTAQSIPPSLVTAAIEHLQKNYPYEIVLSHDHPLSYLQSLKQQEGTNNIYDLSGCLSLRELIALLDRAQLVIATDSGPMHIACARKTPTIALFTTDVPSRWAGPFCHPISMHMTCSSTCNSEKSKTCLKMGCLNGITVDIIHNAIDEILFSSQKAVTP